MNVIITGGNGFVGQHLQRELKEAWPTATVVSWDLPEIDITKPNSYRDELKRCQPDWVVHLAALAPVGASAGQAERYFAVNVEGTVELLTTLESVSPNSRAVVVSSADIYGLTSEAATGQPVPELPLAECRPGNPYAASKLAMEKIIEERFAERVVRVRPFPHVGPGQKTGFVTADFAKQIAAIEQGVQEPIVRVGNLTARRDFTDVRDVVRAYRLLMEHGTVGEVFNVASGKAWSIQEILDQLIALSTSTITVEQDPTRLRPVDIPVLVGDASRLTAATGWVPAIPIDQSLRDVLAWWRTEPRLPR